MDRERVKRVCVNYTCTNKNQDSGTKIPEMGLLRVPAVALLLCAVARGQSCGSIALSGGWPASPTSLLTVSPSLSFGGNFTIELWAKITGGYDNFLFSLTASGSSPPPGFYMVRYRDKTYVAVGGGFGFTSVIPRAGEWYHYAITRAGSVISVFFNGTRVIQTNFSGLIGSPTSVLRIGGYSSGLYLWPGSIANFRVVTGTALYT